jgi:hypothetical protein
MRTCTCGYADGTQWVPVRALGLPRAVHIITWCSLLPGCAPFPSVHAVPLKLMVWRAIALALKGSFSTLRKWSAHTLAYLRYDQPAARYQTPDIVNDDDEGEDCGG